ncbi:MAG: lipoate--protein ligase family protein [Candidatus Gastranaerophilaceae bacterium]|jgi:lipoate-protein ligase A|nr:lipoate--protein ligase family protein [Candidatus Gastranaerophilaceae bacterium]
MTKIIPYNVYTGQENMRIDNELLENAITEQSETPVFRLYGWSPACISLGKNQQDSFIDKSFLKDTGIDLVKRLTGGRALLHDDEITYSYVCPVSYLKHGENVVKSYIEISQILIKKFSEIGIELEFGGQKRVNTKFDYCMLISTGADLCYKGKKLIGSAQCRKQGYILQHGSILYDYNKELLEKIFHEKIDTSSITSIKEINPDIKKDDIISLFKKID